MSAIIDILFKAFGVQEADAGVKQIDTSAKGLGSTLEETGTKAEALSSKLDGVRNSGLAIAAAGAGMLVLSDHMADAFTEADRLGGKLETLMTGRGLADGIDQVRALGEEIAGLTGGDDDQVAANIAGAIASGRLNSLREYGIVIDATGQAAIEAAGKISDQAKQQEIFNQVMRAGAQASETLRASMDASTASLGEMGVRWGNIEEGIGKGAANAKAAFYEGILSPIFDIIEANPGLQETAGAVMTIGGAAGSVGGSLLALAAQAGQAYVGYQTLKAARAADTVVAVQNTSANITNAASKVALTTADTVGAVAAQAHAAAELESAAASTAAGGAAAGATAGVTALATAQAAAATTAITAAGLVGVAFSGVGILVAGVATAATMVTTAVAYEVGQQIGWIDKEQSFVERLTAGWYRLSDAIFKTKNEVGEMAAQTQRELDDELEKRRTENAKAVLNEGKSQEEADRDNIAFEAETRERYAREQFRFGDEKRAVENQERAARLREQMDATGRMGQLQDRSSGDGAPTIDMPDFGGVGVGSGLSPIASVGITSVTPNTDAIDDSILDLQEQINEAKSTGIKTALEAQLAAVKKKRELLLSANSAESGVEGQIANLQEQIRQTESAAQKEQLNEQLRQLQRQLAALKAQNEQAKRGADAAERRAKRMTDAAKKQEQAAIDAQQLSMGVDATRSRVDADIEIKRLEVAREKAEDDKDEARANQLEYEIAVAKAQQAFADKMARAASTSLENADQGKAMEAEAREERRGALAIAELERNKPLKSRRALDALMKSLEGESAAAMAPMPWNPFADKEYAGTSGAFAISSGNIEPTGADWVSSGPRNLQHRIKTRVAGSASSPRIEFTVDPVPLDDLVNNGAASLPGRFR